MRPTTHTSASTPSPRPNASSQQLRCDLLQQSPTTSPPPPHNETSARQAASALVANTAARRSTLSLMTAAPDNATDPTTSLWTRHATPRGRSVLNARPWETRAHLSNRGLRSQRRRGRSANPPRLRHSLGGCIGVPVMASTQVATHRCSTTQGLYLWTPSAPKTAQSGHSNRTAASLPSNLP